MYEYDTAGAVLRSRASRAITTINMIQQQYCLIELPVVCSSPVLRELLQYTEPVRHIFAFACVTKTRHKRL